MLQMSRRECIQKFYSILEKLEKKIGYRYLGQCHGKMTWPNRGIYFFFEAGEFRSKTNKFRVVRIGTHAVSKNSKTSLWNRLRGHRGNLSGKHKGGGNHRGSIFRLHVGTAIINKENLHYNSWGIGSSAATQIRNYEHPLEIKVSDKILSMPFLWLKADDTPDPQSIRKFIERNSIALLSNYQKTVIDPPSLNWLGNYCNNGSVSKSGLWNVDHTDEVYDPSFITLLDSLVDKM
jgi:hypothetical protein